MKIENILDYFGPHILCRVKVKYSGEDDYCYEKDDDFPMDEELLKSYVIEMDVVEDDKGHFLEMIVERDER